MQSFDHVSQGRKTALTGDLVRAVGSCLRKHAIDPESLAHLWFSSRGLVMCLGDPELFNSDAIYSAYDAISLQEEVSLDAEYGVTRDDDAELDPS